LSIKNLCLEINFIKRLIMEVDRLKTQAGLEVNHSYRADNEHHNYNPEPAHVAQATKRERNGPSWLLFCIVVSVVAAVVGAVIGGGLGGSLSSCKKALRHV
jgi:hypothetical protein